VNPPDIARSVRADAGVLHDTGDALRDVADDLDAAGDPAAAAKALSLSALNVAATALALARRGGQLEVLAEVETDERE
jgi:hypothetical protein